ncbi:MAG: NAD(P)-binding protein [Oligoflexia bacterium]|nr:NAD(P)-binding protein [Oligoflexia bacterium]
MKTDFLILGGGLSGLISAAYLERANKNYILIEAQDELGGTDYGLKCVPAHSDILENPLIKLKRDLNLNFNIQTLLNPPLIFQNKTGFSDFTGFAVNNKNRALLDELSYYTQSPRLLVSNGWKTLNDELLKIIPTQKIKTKSVVTSLNFNHGKLESVTINGETQIQANTFAYALPLTSAKALLGKEALSAKFLQKFDRMQKFTVLSVDFASKKSHFTKDNLLVFNDEDFFMIGQFNSENSELSSWLSLIDSELAQDEEAVSKTLKTMKKHIKKAFPNLIEEASWERILVVPESHHSFIDLPQSGPELWFLGSNCIEGSQNIAASIKSSQNFVAKLTHCN